MAEDTPSADPTVEDTLALRQAAEDRLSELERRWRVPPEWNNGSCEMGSELAVMGWDLEWFESSLKRRAVRLLWQEFRLVSSRQYRDWYKLLDQLCRLEGSGRYAMSQFPAYRETQVECVFPMELLGALRDRLVASTARWREKRSDVWKAYASMFDKWSLDLAARHRDQWDRLARKIELEENGSPPATQETPLQT